MLISISNVLRSPQRIMSRWFNVGPNVFPYTQVQLFVRARRLYPMLRENLTRRECEEGHQQPPNTSHLYQRQVSIAQGFGRQPGTEETYVTSSKCCTNAILWYSHWVRSTSSMSLAKPPNRGKLDQCILMLVG